MNIPIERIEYYSMNDFFIINADRQLILLHNRINSTKNVVRVYYTQTVYQEFDLYFDRPTILFSLGLFIFPSSEMAISYVRTVQQTEEELTFSDTMSKLFELTLEHGYTIEDQYDKFMKFQLPENSKNSVEPGYYTIDLFDNQLLINGSDYLEIVTDYKDFHNSRKRVKTLNHKMDINREEYKIIATCLENNENFIDHGKLSTHKYVFEIIVHDSLVYVNVIPIVQNIRSITRNILISGMTGTLIINDTKSLQNYDDGEISIIEDFISSVKMFLTFDYYLYKKSIRNRSIKQGITVVLSTVGMTVVPELLKDKKYFSIIGKCVSNYFTLRKFNKKLG